MRCNLNRILLAQLSIIGTAIGSDDQDPFDLSFYAKGAAIGDSYAFLTHHESFEADRAFFSRYAAGIGAGNELAWACSRYDGSYANLVAIQLGVEPEKLDFTFTACSGALVPGVYKQATRLSSGQEFVLVSAVGDVLDLLSFDILTFA